MFFHNKTKINKLKISISFTYGFFKLSCAEEKEFYATCGRKWSIEPETSHIKRSRSNILRTNPDGELTASSRSVETILDAWQLFFSDDVLEKFILKYSNEHRQNRIETRNLKIEAALQKHIPIDCSCRETIKCKCNCHKKKAEFEPITLNMLKAFIGLLYMKGVKRLLDIIRFQYIIF